MAAHSHALNISNLFKRNLKIFIRRELTGHPVDVTTLWQRPGYCVSAQHANIHIYGSVELLTIKGEEVMLSVECDWQLVAELKDQVVNKYNNCRVTYKIHLIARLGILTGVANHFSDASIAKQLQCFMPRSYYCCFCFPN